MLKKRLGMILGFLILILAGICYFEFRTPQDGEILDHYLLSASGIFFKDPNVLHPAVLSQGGSNTGTYAYALDLANWQNIQYLTLKSATAGSIRMIRKDLLDDLLYVFGTIVYQEDGVISIVQDNVLYKAPLPNSQKDTSFDLGTSVYIFYSNKRKQDYGYDLSGVLAVTE